MPICNVTPEGGGWRNGDIATGANIDADKVRQHYIVTQMLTANDTTNVANISYPIHLVIVPTSTITGFEAVVHGAMTGDRTVTIDLQKSTGGGSYATILSSTIALSIASTVRTHFPAVISDTALVDGDSLRAVVTLGGSTGTLAQGLVVALKVQDRLI